MAAPARLDDLSLLAALADGSWQTGEQLAARFDVTRAAVSKRVGKLQSAGWPITSNKQHGYCAEGGLDLLDAAAISAALPSLSVSVHGQIASTNAAVVEQAWAGPQLVLAEHQTAGRGRRGRTWQAPPGQHLTLTVDWRFEQLAAPATGLSPAIAVALVQGLGLPAVQIKWPNDLVVERHGALHKLGGILIEASGEAGGPMRVIVGVGLNVAALPSIEQATISLRGLGDTRPRSELVICTALAVVSALRGFESDGLQAFAPDYAEHDVLVRRSITIHGASKQQGTALGLAADGGLRVATSSGEQVIYGGDVSVRMT